MSSAFSQTIEGSKPVMIDLGQASGVTITKVTLLDAPEGKEDVKVYLSTIPMATGEEDDNEKPKRKDEVIAEFKDGKKEVETDSMAIDEMEPSVYTVDGAKVKIEGTFMNDDDAEEEDEDDEDDDDAYQGSDSE